MDELRNDIGRGFLQNLPKICARIWIIRTRVRVLAGYVNQQLICNENNTLTNKSFCSSVLKIIQYLDNLIFDRASK